MNYHVARNNECSHPSSAGQGLFAQMRLSEMLVRLEEILEVTKPATSTIAAKQKAGCVSLKSHLRHQGATPRRRLMHMLQLTEAGNQISFQAQEEQEGKDVCFSGPNAPLLLLRPIF